MIAYNVVCYSDVAAQKVLKDIYDDVLAKQPVSAETQSISQ